MAKCSGVDGTIRLYDIFNPQSRPICELHVPANVETVATLGAQTSGVMLACGANGDHVFIKGSLKLRSSSVSVSRTLN